MDGTRLYAPKPKKDFFQLSRCATSKNLMKYHKEASQNITIAPKTPDFTCIKKKIEEFENKAKYVYGINFEESKPGDNEE